MRVYRLLIFVIIYTSFTACANYEPLPTVTQLEKDWFVSNTAAVTNTLIRSPETRKIICMSPAPDVAFIQNEGTGLTLSLLNVSVDSHNTPKEYIANSESSSEEELAGRTPAVLLTRELLYRTCEFSQNHQLTKAEALKLYQETLDIVAKNWTIEAQKTQVTVSDNETLTNKVLAQSGQFEQLPVNSTEKGNADSSFGGAGNEGDGSSGSNGADSSN